MAGDFSTVGRDLVNHCVNDILVQGARPLFFLDYVGAGVLEPPKMVELVRGVADGCRENGCALLGGETAEMPGFYQPGDYELVGFIVGVVDRTRVLDGSRVAAGRRARRPAVGAACTPTATRSRAGSCSTDWASRCATGSRARDRRRPASASGFCAPHLSYLAALTPLLGSPGAPRSRPHHRRRTDRQPAARSARRAAGRDPARQLGDPRAVPYPPGRGRRRARGDVPGLQHGRSAWCSSWRARRQARSRRPWPAPASARGDRLDPDGRTRRGLRPRPHRRRRRGAALSTAPAGAPPGRRHRVAVLLSGRGSNFLALHDAAARGRLPAEIALVVSNEPARPASSAPASSASRPRCCRIAGEPSRAAHEEKLLAALHAAGAEWICLAGYMRLLSASFVGAWPRAHPQHPSEPAAALYRGLHPQRQALAAGAKESGCTVHFVDEGLDSGPIVLQRRGAGPDGRRRAEPGGADPRAGASRLPGGSRAACSRRPGTSRAAASSSPPDAASRGWRGESRRPELTPPEAVD